ncbi:MAG: hydrogenase iron-sulfur subunit [Desulfobacterales bacterium]
MRLDTAVITKTDAGEVDSLDKRVLIIGNGSCARRISQNLINRGIDVVVASRTPDIDPALSSGAQPQHSGFLEVLTGHEVMACQGFIGHFDLVFKSAGQQVNRSTSLVIIAEDYERKPNFDQYGLNPSAQIWSLSQIKESKNQPPLFKDKRSKGTKILFISGLTKESDPVIHEDVMRTALRLQSNNAQSYIFTGNLKVSGNGLEVLSRDLKRAGAVISKFTDQPPQMRQNIQGGLEIEYLDEVTQQRFRFLPDITVVDDTIYPSNYLHHLSDVFDLDTDPVGFLQPDNVHRIPAYTNRKGILVAGPSKAALSVDDQMVDADSTALSAIALLYGAFRPTPYPAEIDNGKCTRCLTCLRLCPHHAIFWDAKLNVNPEACEGCGLCASECPAIAIRQQKLQATMIHQVCWRRSKQNDPASPAIVAFCCSRSAAQSAGLARCMGHRLPPGLSVLEVPCACSISIEYLLASFDHRVEGVLVMVCHDGNCYSGKGSYFARNRVNRIAAFLEHTRLSGKRIEIHSLASNMGREFSLIADRFAKRLIAMGPAYPMMGKQ